jgi:hypothetical protein
MSYLVIGSQACPSVVTRKYHVDTDYIATPAMANVLVQPYDHVYPLSGDKLVGKGNGTVVEVEVAWPGSTGEELLALVYEHGLAQCGNAANADVCLALKLSHRFKASPHFHKTRKDILALRKAGASVLPVLVDWLKRREKETLAYHQHPKLNQSSMGFFRPEEVPYQYVHDTIHLAMAHGTRPAYMEFQMDGAEVRVDRRKWDALPESVRLNSVLEEAYVLALERHQIPNHFTPDPRDSFLIALEKVCTTIASGWWREWAWEHWDEVVAQFNQGYVERLKQGIASGVVKPYARN